MTPPPGYRLLKLGEVIRSGDIYCRGGASSWHETNHTGGRWNPDGYWVMARKESSDPSGLKSNDASFSQKKDL